MSPLVAGTPLPIHCNKCRNEYDFYKHDYLCPFCGFDNTDFDPKDRSVPEPESL